MFFKKRLTLRSEVFDIHSHNNLQGKISALVSPILLMRKRRLKEDEQFTQNYVWDWIEVEPGVQVLNPTSIKLNNTPMSTQESTPAFLVLVFGYFYLENIVDKLSYGADSTDQRQ